nr:ribonuclease H-like domain-containing protein [Tanacetum cinerariifolium]
MHDPREPHFAALKRVLSYVRGRLDFGLQLYASSSSSLVAYSDVVDWAGCPFTWRSTFGYYVFLGDKLLTWSSKRLHTLFRSSVEAEYRGVANHQRTKHIEINIHFVPDMVARDQVRVLHVSSHYQFANIFTKGLHVKFYLSLLPSTPPITVTTAVTTTNPAYHHHYQAPPPPPTFPPNSPIPPPSSPIIDFTLTTSTIATHHHHHHLASSSPPLSSLTNTIVISNLTRCRYHHHTQPTPPLVVTGRVSGLWQWWEGLVVGRVSGNDGGGYDDNELEI